MQPKWYLPTDPVNMKENLSSYLKRYREKADLTQGELAEKLDVSRQSIISLESGRCIPSVSLAMRIARFFGLPIEFIFRSSIETDSCESVFETSDKEEGATKEDNQQKRGGDMARDLLPWSPWREMMSLRETVDRFFDERPSTSVFHPSIGIRETDKELIVEADIPGVRESEVDVEVEDDKLIIRGERKHSEETKREDYYHQESSYGSFSRVIGLPNYVDGSRAEAEVKEGILEVRIPKVEKRQPKKIAVKGKAKPSSETKKEVKKEIK